MQTHGRSSENHELARTERLKYVALFIVKGGLGIILLILGGLAVKNTQGQKDTFGPPYFIGAFIVGCLLILAAMIDIIIHRNIISKADLSSTTALRELTQYVCGEVGFTVISVMAGFIGLFFVCIFGVPECDPKDFFSHCNYTKNLSENRSIATAILIFLIVSELVAIGSIILLCRVCRGLGPYTAFRPRGQYAFGVQQHGYTAGGPSNVVITTAEPPCERPDQRRDYDGFGRDTQVIIGGQVIDKERGGFSGAVLSQPQNVTVVHPPVGFSQYSGQVDQNIPAGYGGAQGTDSVNNLQEQNRLLREQIALQQQQLSIMQQQQQQQQQQNQQHRAPSPNFPAPPSYDSCMQDSAQINRLQEQNRELQDKYQSQQHRIEKMSPPGGEQVKPSAPPL